MSNEAEALMNKLRSNIRESPKMRDADEETAITRNLIVATLQGKR